MEFSSEPAYKIFWWFSFCPLCCIRQVAAFKAFYCAETWWQAIWQKIKQTLTWYINQNLGEPEYFSLDLQYLAMMLFHYEVTSITSCKELTSKSEGQEIDLKIFKANNEILKLFTYFWAKNWRSLSTFCTICYFLIS